MSYDEEYDSLRSAVLSAGESGELNADEIREIVEDALEDVLPSKPHIGGGPKRPKKDVK